MFLHELVLDHQERIRVEPQVFTHIYEIQTVSPKHEIAKQVSDVLSVEVALQHVLARPAALLRKLIAVEVDSPVVVQPLLVDGLEVVDGDVSLLSPALEFLSRVDGGSGDVQLKLTKIEPDEEVQDVRVEIQVVEVDEVQEMSVHLHSDESLEAVGVCQRPHVLVHPQGLLPQDYPEEVFLGFFRSQD